MEPFSRSDKITSEDNSNSFVYDILSEGHLQATAHRVRSYSMHTSRCTSRDTGLRTKRYRQRRMSMPPNEGRVSREHSNVLKDHDIEQLKGLKLNEGKERNNNRRATSFKERPQTTVENLRRVRSFKTTSRGLVNRGDSVNIKNETDYRSAKCSDQVLKSTGCKYLIPQLITSRCSNDSSRLKVLLTGARDVGKTSLIQQFMTSEFLGSGNVNISQSEDERTVTLQVDGEESTLEFVQSEDFQEQDESFQIDGFVVVYCITKRATFDIAIDLLKQIRDEVGSNKAIILAGNKSDLVRKRTISQAEGRSAADAYGCKYIELSAALNHRVDELLVGIHKQIKLKSGAEKEELECKISKEKEGKSSFKRTKRFLEKLFLGHSGKDKKTENLYVE